MFNLFAKKTLIAESWMLDSTNVKLLSSAEMAVFKQYRLDLQKGLGKNCAPFVVTEPQDLCTDPGHVIELSCMIEGNPIPRFQWYKNDYPISNEVTTILKVTHSFLGLCV